MFRKVLNLINIHPDSNQKWLLISLAISGLLITYAHPTLLKAIISGLPAQWIAFESLAASIAALLMAYESPQCDTPVDALYDAYTWLIKNGKIELDEEEREFADNIVSYRKEVDVAYQKGYKEGVKAALENKLSESAKILLYND